MEWIANASSGKAEVTLHKRLYCNQETLNLLPTVNPSCVEPLVAWMHDKWVWTLHSCTWSLNYLKIYNTCPCHWCGGASFRLSAFFSAYSVVMLLVDLYLPCCYTRRLHLLFLVLYYLEITIKVQIRHFHQYKPSADQLRKEHSLSFKAIWITDLKYVASGVGCFVRVRQK